MVFSKSTNMAMQAMVFMTKSQNKKYFSVPELAEQLECSKTYLNKIMQLMVKAGLLVSRTGPGMGFAFAREPEKITLFDIIRVTNDTGNFKKCFFGWDECEDKNPCPLHDYYKSFRNNISEKIEKLTLVQASDKSWPLSAAPLGSKPKVKTK